MYCKDDFAADHTENHLDALPKLFDFDDEGAGELCQRCRWCLNPISIIIPYQVGTTAGLRTHVIPPPHKEETDETWQEMQKNLYRYYLLLIKMYVHLFHNG